MSNCFEETEILFFNPKLLLKDVIANVILLICTSLLHNKSINKLIFYGAKRTLYRPI